MHDCFYARSAHIIIQLDSVAGDSGLHTAIAVTVGSIRPTMASIFGGDASSKIQSYVASLTAGLTGSQNQPDIVDNAQYNDVATPYDGQTYMVGLWL
jgi:hypothetical protein